MMNWRRACGIAMGSLALASTLWAQLPDPAKGGKSGGPVDLLILRGHAIMNFGVQPPLDEAYQKKLKDAGFRVTIASEWQDLTPAYLKQFNVIAYLNPSADLSGGYFDATEWNGGWHHLTVRRNTEVLRR